MPETLPLIKDVRTELNIEGKACGWDKAECKPSDLSLPYYPTDETLCRLASIVYENNTVTLPGWQQLYTGKNSKDGYFGVAFWHEGNGQLVISHRGTNSFKAVKADIDVVRNEFTPQLHSACSFAYYVTHKLKAHTHSTSITGHSLGGWLAQATAFAIEYTTIREGYFWRLEKKDRKHHPHTVTFDSPGCYEMLCKLSDRYFHRYENLPHNLISILDITTYFIAPNLVNTTNKHAGTLFFLDLKKKTEIHTSSIFKPLASHTFECHPIDRFLDAFKTPCKLFYVLDWPVSTVLEKIKYVFIGSDNDEYNKYFKYDSKTLKLEKLKRFKELNKDAVVIHFKIKNYDETIRKSHIFTEEEATFLNRWREFKKSGINPFEFNKFLFENNLDAFHNFLPDFEILENKDVSCSDSEKLTNRVKRLFMNFPDAGEIMKKQILGTPSIFKAIHNARKNAYIQTLLSTYFKDANILKRLNLEIPVDLRQFLDSKTENFIVFITKNTKDEAFRIYNILEGMERNKKEYSLLGVEDVEYLEKCVDVTEVLKSINNLLVIDLEGRTDFPLLNVLHEKISDGSEKKIICLAQNRINTNSKIFQTEIEEIRLTDISEISVKALLTQKIVSLNGCQFTLNDFLKKNELAVLSKFLPFSVLKETLFVSDNITVCHFENKLLHKIFLNFSTGKVLKSVAIDTLEFILENYESTAFRSRIGKPMESVIFLVTGDNENELLKTLKETYPSQIYFPEKKDEEEYIKYFQKLCREHHKKTIFRLHGDDKESGDLRWIDLFDRDLYMKRKFVISEKLEVNEEELIARNEKLVLISNSAGMGKSTVLCNLYTDITNSWTFWINLVEAHKYIDIDNTTVDIDGVVRFLLQTHNNSSKLAECLLKFSLTNENSMPVYLFFDAFDEIQDSENKKKDETRSRILNILKCLKEKTFGRIFISTRSYDCENLEKELGVTHIKLKKIEEEKQIAFCTKFWKIKRSLVNDRDCKNYDSFRIYAEKLLAGVERSIDKQIRSFLGIPLQLRMIVKVFQPDETQETPPADLNLNLYNLYSLFIDRKYEIFFEEKTCFLSDFYKNLLKPQFQEIHKILGMAHLFPELSLKINYGNLNSFNGIGLVEVKNKTINFVHRTFAEYFAAELFVYWMENNPDEKVKVMLVEKVLKEHEYAIIQHFISDILATKKKSSKILQFYPETSAKIHRGSVLDGLLQNDLRSLIKIGCAKLTESILENFKYFTSAKNDLTNATSNEGTMLDMAINFSRLQMALTQLEYGVDVNVRNENNQTYLHASSKSKVFNPLSVKLMKKLAKHEMRDSFDKDPWDYAYDGKNWDLFFDVFKLYEGDENFIRKLGTEILRIAINENKKDVAINLITSECLDLGNLKFIRAWNGMEYDRYNLIKKLVEMREGNQTQQTKKQFFKELLEKNDVWSDVLQLPNVNFQNKNEPSFLHFAIAQKKIEVAKNLIEKKAKINALDCYKVTPIYLAAENECWDLIDDYFDEIDFDILMGRDQMNLLDLACARNQLTIALKIIDEKIDLNQRDDHQSSDSYKKRLLLLAAKNGNWQLVTKLIEKFELDCCDFNFLDSCGKTILHFACQDNEADLALKLITENKANLNSVDTERFTPVLLAAKNNHWELVTDLIQKSLEDNMPIECINALLCLACKDNQLNLALKLIEDNSGDINCLYCEDNPVLLAAENNYWGLVTKLMKIRDFDLKLSDKNKRTLLHFACESNKKDLVFQSNGHDSLLFVPDKYNLSPVSMAARKGHWELVQDILKSNEGFVSNISNEDKSNLICLACKDNKKDIALELISKGVDKNARDPNGDTPLLCAARNGHFDLVEELLKKDGFDVKISSNNYKKTLLHFACQRNQTDIVSRLITKKEFDIDFADNEENNAVLLAAGNGHWDLVSKLIDDHGASVSSENIFKENLLHLACRDNQTETALKLIKRHNLHINVLNSYERSPIFFAAEHGHWALVLKLIKLNADTTIPDKDKTTVLHFACRDDKVEIAKLLIKKGCDPNRTDIYGLNPLTLAKRNGHDELVKVISDLLKFRMSDQ